MNIKRTLCIAFAALTGAAVSAPRSAPAEVYNSAEQESGIYEVIDYVFDRCLLDGYGGTSYGASAAVFYMGALRAAEVTGESKYFEHVRLNTPDRNWNAAIGYKPLDASILQVYGKLYAKQANAVSAENIAGELDRYFETGLYDYSTAENVYSLGWLNHYISSVTGDEAYAAVDMQSYKKSRTVLFDFDEGLWYGDKSYVLGRGANSQTLYGEKIFDAASNALVYVSLADRLEYADKDGDGYAMFLYDFVAMSESILARQREDGFWNCNLAVASDPADISGAATAGMLYGISMGIKLGILSEEKFVSAADGAYAALSASIETCIRTDFDCGLALTGLSAYSQLQNGRGEK